MYKVVFEYADGRKGVCIEKGKVCLFETEQEARALVSRLNNAVVNYGPFFPVWYVEKV